MIVGMLVIAFVGIVAGALCVWRLDQREREIERQRQGWRERSLRAHRGRCPWSGRPGIAADGIEWVTECPRCQGVFVSYSGDSPILPEHTDDRSR